MTHYYSVVTDFCAALNYGEGTNLHLPSQFGLRIYDGGRVYSGGNYYSPRPTMEIKKILSATSTPSTKAFPENRQVFIRILINSISSMI